MPQIRPGGAPCGNALRSASIRPTGFNQRIAGGQLTESGVLAAAEAMKARCDLWNQIGMILESGEADLLAEFVRLLYQRVTTTSREAAQVNSQGWKPLDGSCDAKTNADACGDRVANVSQID
jgi:hypothetical protein